jgi:hypothetical protein
MKLSTENKSLNVYGAAGHAIAPGTCCNCWCCCCCCNNGDSAQLAAV